MGLIGRKVGRFVRAMAVALSVCLGVAGMATPVSASAVGDGNSNDRISTYINLAAGKSLMDEDLSGVSLSKDQLRFLGVYISNFFVPFGTEIGEAAGDETQTIMDQVKDALQSGLNFSDGYADTFAETIMGLSRSSATDLVFAASVNYHEGYIINDRYKPNASYYNFLTTMLGSGRFIIDAISPVDDVASPLQDEGESLQYGYWGYMNGTEFVPVADFYIDIEDGLTASQVAFIACLNSVDPEMGFGWNVWDLNSQEVANSQELASMTAELYLNMSIFGEKMMVDCFGNIIVYGHQHQIIAVPGCVNPYTWISVDAEGNDRLDAGEAYNMVNLPSMALADAGIGPNNAIYSSTSTATADTSIGTVRHSVSLGADTDMGELAANSPSSTLTLRGNLAYILSYCDSVSGNLSEWSVTVEDGNVIISATLSSMESLDSSKIAEGWDDYVDQDKYDTFQADIEYFVDEGISRDDLMAIVESIQTNAEEEISSLEGMSGDGESQDTDSSTGRSNVLLKSLYPLYPFVWDPEAVATDSPLDEENFRFLAGALKIYRGTNKSDLDQEIGFWSASAWKESLKDALEYYHTTYPYDSSITLSNWTLSDGFETADSISIEVNMMTSTSIALPVNFMDCLVVIDDLAAYNFNASSTEVTDYRTFNALNYINEDNSTINNSTGGLGWSYGSGNNFSAGYTDIETGSVSTPINISDAAKVSLYVSYCFSSLYNSSPTDKAATIGMVGYRMNVDGMPTIPNDPLMLSEDGQTDVMLTSIRNWLYYLLHPIEGVNYVRELITNKLNGFLLGWHNDMLGTNGVGQTTGSTLYQSNTGYVTTPDLSEIEWTDALINFYNQCIPFLLVVMIVTMIFAYITGILSLQRSIFGVVIFGIFLLLPVNLINGVVGFSNRISENLYGEKFTYWALIQQETYASAIDEAADRDVNGDSTYSNYLQELYAQNNAVYSNQGSESIVLKWQAPKKMTSIMIGNDESYQGLTEEGQFLLNAFLSNMYSGETFLDDEDSVYLYRSYLDISNYSRYIWRGIDQDVQSMSSSITNDLISNVSNTLQDAIHSMSTNYALDRQNGYTNSGSSGTDPNSNIRMIAPLSSKIINDALGDLGTVDEMGIDDFVGINQNLFNFGIPVFNTGGSIADYLGRNTDNASDIEIAALNQELAGYSNEDLVGLAAYSLMSESVFYYFSWNLYDMGMQPSATISDGYRNLLLGDDNAGFFYNTILNGELKDFMDMKSLFTYIIPYLKMCNDLVNEWDDVYGLFIYDGVPTEEGHWNDPDIQGNTEMEQRYWHNLNVARLYGIYTPWVDVMYDCSYADGEYINAVGERFYVPNPIDPATYPDERPMIFSESEMHEYGLGEGDLTKVERLILDCNRGMEERMYELLNYYNFSDVTLNTAAAMNCAFEFNNTFSENGIFADNHNIYPQSFELADFSYDAFLRFILSNTTGEEMNSTEDFYANIVENSSMTTVLIMLILDILSMYVLPAFKIFFLIAVFLAALFIIVTTAFRVDPEQKFIKRLASGVLLPMLKFVVITIGFAYVISLFMGTGNNAVTQSRKISIQMGDPVVVMIAMCAIDIIVLVLYFKVIRKVVQDIKRDSKMAINFMGGVFGGAAAMAMGAIGGAALAGSRGAGNATATRGSREDQDAQRGTGVENERAQQRGSHDVDDAEEVKDSTRRNDTKRDTVRMDQASPKSKEEEKEKKENLNERTKKGMDKLNAKDKSDNAPQKRQRSSNIPRFTKFIKDPGAKHSDKKK